jgi:diacylglycerol kinase family enzyme
MIERLRVQLPPNRLAVTADPDEVETAIHHFCDVGVDLLCVVGGDGTVTGTLTPLVEAWDDPPLPALCLLPGGTINTISKSIGTGAAPDRALARLLREGARSATRRSVLAVRPAGGPARYGMIFGLGVVSRFLDHYYSHRTRGTLAAGLGVAHSLASVLTGGALGRDLFTPFAAKVESDAGPVVPERLTGLAAGAVRDLGLGFRPFFGAGRKSGHFHWIWTRSTGPGIALELPAAALGTTVPGGALHHETASRLRVQLVEPLPYTVDGDLFPPARTLEIEAGPELRFLAP